MDVTLVMFSQSGERRDFDVEGKSAIIGRSGGCSFQISLPVVSRKHCELIIKSSRIFVRDLGSSNGTYVNNKRVQEAELHAGDTLIVGPVIFTLVVDGRPAEIKPIKTILDAPKKAAKAKMPEDGVPASVDLGGSDTMDVLPEDDEDAHEEHNPLAELEALSRQKKA